MARNIALDWKISRVLSEYPELLEQLIALSPAFNRLRNPLLRRVQTKLVTVEQAARIAGLDPGQMLAALNEDHPILPAEHQQQSAATATEMPIPYTTLDVRPMLKRGDEPFTHIMAAARAVPLHETLLIIASFEPVPLYDALANVGFTCRARQVSTDEWQVFATRTNVSRKATTSGPETPAETYAEVTIDVSELVPPEPMMKILSSLNTLAPGGTLRVHHQRRPIYLYERLDEMGYAHTSTEKADGGVEIIIHKPGDAS